MSWRSVVITRPASLSYKHRAMQVHQDEGDVSIPLEDIAVVLIDNPQVNVSALLLSALVQQGIVLVTVGDTHHPNGLLLPLLPHSRTLKVLRTQLSVTQPRKKRLWQQIVRRKILNQAAVVDATGNDSLGRVLLGLAETVKSGDTSNVESHASLLYFPSVFGKGFTRSKPCLVNAALNYGYAVVRAAIARSLVNYGLLPVLGLHHNNEQNAFNLADDLLEPFRPLVDVRVRAAFPEGETDRELVTRDKALLVNILHEDTTGSGAEIEGRRTLLATVDVAVISLVRCLTEVETALDLPVYSDMSPL